MPRYIKDFEYWRVEKKYGFIFFHLAPKAGGEHLLDQSNQRNNQIGSKKQRPFREREMIAGDGARICVKLESFELSAFKITGEGFKPNESLNFVSTPYQEVLYYQIEADEMGTTPHSIILPAVVGEEGGICDIYLFREKDSLHLNFPWGLQK